MGAPQTLPADFQGWDSTPPQTLPANFNQWDQQSAPDQSGQVTNDVGNVVTVPKPGEDSSDTIKRAIVYQKSLTPQQRDEAIAKETATMPAKAAETLGAAAGIGVAGPALLAAPGEGVAAIKAIPGATEAILQHLEENAAEYAAKYPHLLALAGKLGIPTTVGGLILYLAKDKK